MCVWNRLACPLALRKIAHFSATTTEKRSWKIQAQIVMLLLVQYWVLFQTPFRFSSYDPLWFQLESLICSEFRWQVYVKVIFIDVSEPHIYGATLVGSSPQKLKQLYLRLSHLIFMRRYRSSRIHLLPYSERNASHYRFSVEISLS